MQPYYDEDGITICHGDYREVLPMDADAVISDPPSDAYTISRWTGPVHGARGSKTKT
jgi:hypothetical protein